LPGSGTRSRGRRRGEDEEEDAEILRVMGGIFRRIGATDSAKLRSRTRNS
jgi:hypothetical protein